MKNKYWYFITTEYCVLCGREKVYKERNYGVKPKSWDKTHKFTELACSTHFI